MTRVLPSVLALLVTAAVVAGCRSAPRADTGPAGQAIGEVRVPPDVIASGRLKVEPIVAKTEPNVVHSSGKAGFDPNRVSDVSSPLVGQVAKILVNAGDAVSKGQVVAVVDSPDLAAAFSDFIKARADRVLAERSYALAKDLFAAKAMARKDLQHAEDELVKARAELRRTRERLLSLHTRAAELDRPLEELHVRSAFDLIAPIAGTVIERALILGQRVGGDSDKPLFTIADLSVLWVTADIYERDLPLIAPGQPVRVEALAWPGKVFSGRIDRVADTVDAESRTVKIVIAVDNPRRELKPAMFASAAVTTGDTSTKLSVPLAAVHGEGVGQPYVFVAVDGDRFAPRPVTLGARFQDRVVIASGLGPDVRVAAEGSILLRAQSARRSADSEK